MAGNSIHHVCLCWHRTHVIMLYTHIQTRTRQLNQFAARAGLSINNKNTQILRINSKRKNRILIDDQELWEVDKYNSLGANVSKQG